MKREHWLSTCIGLFLVAGCGDDTTAGTGTDGETETEGDTFPPVTTTETTQTTQTTDDTTTTDPSTTTIDPTDTDPTGDTTSTTGPEPPAEAEFFVRIENISGDSALPTGFAPFLWVEQELGVGPAFDTDVADAGEGLEALAEDGDPTTLLASVETAAGVYQAGVVAIPDGAADPGPIGPGEMYEFTLTSQNGARLALLGMLTGSNDVFLGTGPQGIALWTNAGFPQDEREITGNLLLWDAGTEFNQPPGAGGYQAPSQTMANEGMPESGWVAPKRESTRALPQAGRVVDVQVTYDLKTEEFTIEINNLGSTVGSVFSDFTPVLWALSDDTFSMFQPGSLASDYPGLESLAEDGDATDRAADVAANAAVTMSDVTATGVPVDGNVTITVNPTEAGRFFSFISMIAQTNDAFIGTPTGVALLDENAAPRPTANIERDFQALLGVWDAGTEANEVPGVGPNQAPRQIAANTGAADPIDLIRYYHDDTDDLASLGDLMSVTIVNGATTGQFDVTIENTSGGTAFPLILTPVVYAVHDDTVMLFESGVPASPGLESLAEDGIPTGLFGEIDQVAGFDSSAVVDTPDGAMGAGPIGPGDSYSFTLTTTSAAPNFNFASMIVPSNDTFVSLGTGISLYDGDTALTDEELATAVAAALNAWDAGTEANQAGAIGRDQAPRQTAENTGVGEGNGLVQAVNDKDPFWIYPDPAQVIRVTVGPVR